MTGHRNSKTALSPNLIIFFTVANADRQPTSEPNCVSLKNKLAITTHTDFFNSIGEKMINAVAQLGQNKVYSLMIKPKYELP